jgi:hypothetical protein
MNLPAPDAPRCQCKCGCNLDLQPEDDRLCETCHDLMEWGSDHCGFKPEPPSVEPFVQAAPSVKQTQAQIDAAFSNAVDEML